MIEFGEEVGVLRLDREIPFLLIYRKGISLNFNLIIIITKKRSVHHCHNG